VRLFLARAEGTGLSVDDSYRVWTTRIVSDAGREIVSAIFLAVADHSGLIGCLRSWGRSGSSLRDSLTWS